MSLYITMLLFVLLQFSLVVLMMLKKIDRDVFELQLIILTILIVLLLNVSMIIIYCRWSGMPYLS